MANTTLFSDLCIALGLHNCSQIDIHMRPDTPAGVHVMFECNSKEGRAVNYCLKEYSIVKKVSKHLSLRQWLGLKLLKGLS